MAAPEPQIGLESLGGQVKGLSRSLTRPHSLSEGVSASLCMYFLPTLSVSHQMGTKGSRKSEAST